MRLNFDSASFRSKFELIAVQGHPRSSTLVQIESAYATSYYSLGLIVTLDVSPTVFEALNRLALARNGCGLQVYCSVQRFLIIRRVDYRHTTYSFHDDVQLISGDTAADWHDL